jgi:hypothetical protein
VAGFAIGSFILLLPGGPQTTATIKPQIYSPSANIGVLNEQANFTITVNNNTDTPLNGSIIISSGATTYQNISYKISAQSSKEIKVSQQLQNTGIWKVDVQLSMTTIQSYAFEVELNQDQANLKANQYYLNIQSIQISYFAIGVSIISAIFAGLAYFRPRQKP